MQFYYGAQSDGSVGLVHKFIWKGDAMEGDWYMDGKKTSGNMYETYYKKYHANATWYSFAQSSNNNLIRKELSNTKHESFSSLSCIYRAFSRNYIKIKEGKP